MNRSACRLGLGTDVTATGLQKGTNILIVVHGETGGPWTQAAYARGK